MSWLDRKSHPVPETDGNLEHPAYIQVALGAGVEGLLLGGSGGAAASLAGGLAGALAEHRSGKAWLGLVTGATVGAAVAGLQHAYLGAGPALPALAAGGLLGAFQALGASPVGRVRDASDVGAVLAGAALPGAAKVSGGIAGAVAERWFGNQPAGLRMILGGAVGAGVAVAGHLAGLAGPSLWISAGVGGLTGALSPLIGPRFGQFVRNLSRDAGVGAEAGLRKAGVLEKPLGPVTRNLIGAIPVGLATEMGKALAYADGNLLGMLVGGVAQTLQIVDVLYQSEQKTGSRGEDVLSTTT